MVPSGRLAKVFSSKGNASKKGLLIPRIAHCRAYIAQWVQQPWRRWYYVIGIIRFGSISRRWIITWRLAVVRLFG
jgi:hypothetical protein